MDRLNCQEEAFAKDSRVGCRNTGFVFVLKRLAFSPLEVVKALEDVQRRHGALRKSLDASMKHWIHHSNWKVDDHIDLEFRDEESEDLIELGRRVLEEEMEFKFVSLSRLFRMIVCGGGRVFVVVFSHCLFDGRSRVIFANDFLRALRGLPLGEKEHVGALPIDALRLEEPGDINVDGVLSEAFRPVAFDDASHTGPIRVRVELFKVDNMDLYLEKCRANKTTFTSAFVVALVKSFFPGEERPVAVGVAINARKIANLNLPDSELLDAGLPSGAIVNNAESDFWACCHAAKASLQKQTDELTIAKLVIGGYKKKCLEADWTPANPFKIEVPFIVSNLGVCQGDFSELTAFFGVQG
jgi:hypothetical protein